MTEAVHAALRMRDVVLCLRAAAEHQATLNRIRLQKYVYLTDALSLVYATLPPVDGHITYKNGPYDRAIQNAVDALAFRGFVHVAAGGVDGGQSTTYTLSSSGRTLATQLSDTPDLAVRWTAISDIAGQLDIHGWHRLRELAYAEPTFVRTRPSGLGQRLYPAAADDSNANAILRLMRHSLAHGYADKQPTRALLLDLFFRFLNQYSMAAAAQLT